MSAGGAELVAVVSSFDRRALLEEALGSLGPALAGCGQPAAAVVFDAGSRDGSREFLARFRFPGGVAFDAMMPDAAEPPSFSAGVNAACRRALALHPGARWLLLFETDNWLAGPEPLARAVQFLEANREFGAAGFTVRKHSGEPAGYGRPFPGWCEFVLGPALAMRLQLDRPRWVVAGGPGSDASASDVVFTSPLMVRREAWEAVGGFDEARFPFSECDIDLAWRMRAAGWRQAVMRESGVVHDNRSQLSAWSAMRVLDLHRARLAVIERGRTMPLLRLGLALRHCAELGVAAVMPGPGRGLRMRKRLLLLGRVFAGYRSPEGGEGSR